MCKCDHNCNLQRKDTFFSSSTWFLMFSSSGDYLSSNIHTWMEKKTIAN